MRLPLAALILAALRSHAQTLPAVPDNLKPPAGETLSLQAHASGDQIYTCDGSSWTLKGPDAKLFDEAGKQVGTHFAGPTWQWSDGSRVVGKPVANATPDPDSIPWLLLTATGHQGGGVMKPIVGIQRISTHGGKPPASGSDAAHKGRESRSKYTAVYNFYTVEGELQLAQGFSPAFSAWIRQFFTVRPG
jgi:hypothetical protein